MKLLAIFCFLGACSSLKKDNEPRKPLDAKQEIAQQYEVYKSQLQASLDDYGLITQEGSIGDSALFSCLALASGAVDFDPNLFFFGQKPVRHPDISPEHAKTPISKDMVNGLLWCAFGLGNLGKKELAQEIIGKMISFGKAHSAAGGWLFCTEEDRNTFDISNEDWLGKCLMTPAVIKDIYRVSQWLDMGCDRDCRIWSEVGVNIPNDATGFERHLAVITTLRNGLIENAINDNSLKVLENAKNAQPDNALYQAAFHVFKDGNQAESFQALMKHELFPKENLPTSENYCSPYLFQRDYPSDDWLPCEGSGKPDGRGVDWLFAAAISLGKMQ